jgi:hypothetical protein
MKFGSQDGSKHFVLLVQRQGEAKSRYPLADSPVTEYGMPDLLKGFGALATTAASKAD